MARGLFTTGFTVAEVLAIQQRAKEMLLEGKTIMNWSDANTSSGFAHIGTRGCNAT